MDFFSPITRQKQSNHLQSSLLIEKKSNYAFKIYFQQIATGNYLLTLL